MAEKKPFWRRVLAIVLGVVALGTIGAVMTVRMTESTQFCSRCHVMKPMYQTLVRSQHRKLTCNDCHTPQDNYVKKVAYKGMAGIWDAYVYYTGRSPQIFEASATSKKIIHANCIRCHANVVAEIDTHGGKKCFECHRSTPHGERSYERAERG